MAWQPTSSGWDVLHTDRPILYAAALASLVVQAEDDGLMWCQLDLHADQQSHTLTFLSVELLTKA